MLRLRLKRLGHKHRPFYRIGAFDARAPRDGRAVDDGLGHYDPLEPDNEKKVTLNRERILHWLDRGAQPSRAVANILKKNGIYVGPKGRSKGAKKAKKEGSTETA